MTDTCMRAALAFGLIAGLTRQTPVCAAAESPHHLSLTLPHGAWTAAAVDRRVVLFTLGQPHRGIGGRASEAAPHVVELRACSVRVGRTGSIGRDPTWALVTKLAPFFPEYPFRLAAQLDPEDGSALLLIEIGGAATRFQFGRVSVPGEAKTSPPRGARPRRQHERHGVIEWDLLRRIDYHGAKPGFYLSSSRSPSLAKFRGQIFVAGQSYYPQTSGVRALWVAGLNTLKAQRLTGALLGQGRGPALVASATKLICLGIVPVKVHSDNSRWFHGRLVAWASDDGTRWKPWQHGLRLADIFAVDACSDGKSTLIACAHNPSAPAVSVFRLVAESGKLRLVRTIAGGATYRATKPMAIRLIDGKPYLFTPREVEGKHTLVISLIRPARDAGSTP